MDRALQTPVTIKCDHPSCPEVSLTIALAVDNIGDLADVRRRAVTAAIDTAESQGWRVHFTDGSTVAAYCPLHRAARVLL